MFNELCQLCGNHPLRCTCTEIVKEDRMMKWFAYEHLPEHLRVVSIKFYEVACSLCAIVEPGPERTVALRKLLESKDAAVRAKLNPGG